MLTTIFSLPFLVCHYKYLNSFSAGTVFIRQNLTSTYVKCWRIETVPALKELSWTTYCVYHSRKYLHWAHYVCLMTWHFINIVVVLQTAYKAIDALIEITTDIDPVFNIDKIMPSGISKVGLKIMNIYYLRLSNIIVLVLISYFINPYNADIFMYKPWRPKGFLIWNHHKCLSQLFPINLNTYVMGLWPLYIF